MTVKFNLHSYKKDSTLIYLIFRHGKTIQYSTGEKINPAHWSKEKQRARKTWPGYKTLNMVLDKLSEEATDYYRTCQVQKIEFTREGLRDKLDEVRQKRPIEVEDRSFFGYFAQYIKTRSVGLSEARVGQYKTTLKHIKAFSPRIDWDGINSSYYFQFIEFLYSQGMETNTAMKYIKILKKVLRDAGKDGYHESMAYTHFKTTEKPVDKTYFTLDELTTLYRLDLSGYKEKTRDLALVYAFTGVRFDDLWKITKDNIFEFEGRENIRIKTKKSQMTIEAVIPLHPIVKITLEKYGGALPKISNQKFNEYIKEVAEVAGFDEPFKMVKHIGGKPKEVILPKHKCISAHTFRRTFITNGLKEGIPPQTLMDIVGIKKMDTLLKYNVIQKEESAAIAANSKLFLMPLKKAL